MKTSEPRMQIRNTSTSPTSPDRHYSSEFMKELKTWNQAIFSMIEERASCKWRYMMKILLDFMNVWWWKRRKTILVQRLFWFHKSASELSSSHAVQDVHWSRLKAACWCERANRRGEFLRISCIDRHPWKGYKRWLVFPRHTSEAWRLKVVPAQWRG